MSLRGQPQAGRGNLGMRKSFVCKRLLRSARNDKRRLPFSWHKKNVLLWTLLRQFVERDPTASSARGGRRMNFSLALNLLRRSVRLRRGQLRQLAAG